MSKTYRATLRIVDGHQEVVLPPEIHLEGDDFVLSQDESTGALTIAPHVPHKAWREMFAYMDSLDVPEEVLDEYMADRPMNRQVGFRNVFEDEEWPACSECSIPI